LRKVLLIIWLIATGWAEVKTGNMFITKERYNPYTFGEEYMQSTKDANKSSVKLTGGDLSFKATLGYVAKYKYEKWGNDILLSAMQTLPKAIPNFPDFFVQGDLGLMFVPLQSSVLHDVVNYIHLGAYAGYGFDIIDEKTRILPRVGVAQFVSPDFTLSPGIGSTVERDIGEESMTLIADVSVVGWAFYFNAGIKLNYGAQ